MTYRTDAVTVGRAAAAVVKEVGEQREQFGRPQMGALKLSMKRAPDQQRLKERGLCHRATSLRTLTDLAHVDRVLASRVMRALPKTDPRFSATRSVRDDDKHLI